ncbi:MAG TPA: GNAT family N-acetyltransferase [Polyangiaceae bacterium]|nr:GNAT family N-acetyltransferase [Polyangiaceae bacterium]
MLNFRVAVASTEQEIRDAQRVRFRVYVDEERMLARRAGAEELDSDERDFCPYTTHVLVYRRGEPVGTVRLLRPRTSPDADLGRLDLDLDLSSNFRLSGFAREGLRLGEVTRFCVLRSHRGSSAAALLFSALCRESVRHSITHWVAAANTQTDDAEDAEVLSQIVVKKSLGSPEFAARPLTTAVSREPTRRIYSAEEVRLARAGRCESLELPPVLSLFARRMGALYIGPPAYDAHFNVFAMPLVSRVRDCTSVAHCSH